MRYAHCVQQQAVIYTRVSKLKDNSRSTADQEAECRVACERNGWPVRAVFCDDDIGASRWSRKDRPQWAKLKATIRKGDVLVVWEASRGYRDLEEFVIIRNLCVELEISLCYSGRVLDLAEADDRFVGGLDALLAEREAEFIRNRVLRGKRTAALAEGGARPQGRAPWGYRRVEIGVWERDEIEAPRVEEAVRRLIAHESMHSVLRWLKDTPGYSPCDITMLRRAVSNPALAGLRVHQGQVVNKGTWPPIITEKQHKQLLLRFGRAKATRSFQSVPGPEPKYLLSGIAKCGVCGAGLTHKTYRTNRKPLYVCNTGHVSRIAEELDATVEDRLFNILAAVNPADHESEDPEMQQHLDDLKEAEEELEGWMQSAENGEVTRLVYMRMEKALTAKIELLRNRLVRAPVEAVDVAAIKANWGNWEVRRRREVVRAFFTITVPPLRKTEAGGRLRATRWDVNIERIRA